MASVLYSQAEFQSYVDLLKSYVGMLDAELAECRAKRSEIPGFWEDNEAYQYMEVIDKNINVCEKTIFKTNIQIAEFEQNIASMTDIQNVEQATIGEAMYVVNKLL